MKITSHMNTETALGGKIYWRDLALQLATVWWEVSRIGGEIQHGDLDNPDTCFSIVLPCHVSPCFHADTPYDAWEKAKKWLMSPDREMPAALPESQSPLGDMTGEEYAELNQGRRGPPHPTFGDPEELVKLQGWYNKIVSALGDDLVLKRIGEMQQKISKLSIYKQDMNIEYGKLEKWFQEAQKEIKRLEARPTPLPTLRPIAELPEKVPEGCKRVYSSFGTYVPGKWCEPTTYKGEKDTHACDILLPVESTEDKMRAEFEEAVRKSRPDKLPTIFSRSNGKYDDGQVEAWFRGYELRAKSTPETK